MIGSRIIGNLSPFRASDDDLILKFGLDVESLIVSLLLAARIMAIKGLSSKCKINKKECWLRSIKVDKEEFHFVMNLLIIYCFKSGNGGWDSLLSLSSFCHCTFCIFADIGQ